MATIPGKKSKGLSACPKPNPGPEASRVPAAQVTAPGFQRLLPLPQAASTPCLSPAPPLTLDVLVPAPGARACKGGRRQGRSAKGASAHALFWDPLQAWVSTCGGPLGKRLGCWGSGPPRQGGEGLRPRDARRVYAQRESGLPPPFPSEPWCRGLPRLVCMLAWEPGGGRGNGRGTPWLERLGTCSCDPEGLAGWRRGRNVRRGLLQDVLTWDSGSSWVLCPLWGKYLSD